MISVFSVSPFKILKGQTSRNTENPRLLWGFAFRCFVRKTPKVVRRTAKIQRLYWASHFGVSFAKHRKSFAEQRNSNAFIGFRISVFLAQNTESRSHNSEHSTLLWGFACRCFLRKTTKFVRITANIQRLRESANVLSGYHA